MCLEKCSVCYRCKLKFSRCAYTQYTGCVLKFFEETGLTDAHELGPPLTGSLYHGMSTVSGTVLTV